MGEIIKRETREFKRNLKRLGQLFLIILIVYFSYLYFFTKPSNQRDWEYGFEILPQLSIDTNKVKINNLRDYEYLSSESGEIRYKNSEVDLTNLERVWFVHEPFYIKPFTNFGGVAHTYFVFDFKDADPIAVSVEARREKGEIYDSWKGMLNNYELFYVWGTETDETVRRVVDQKNKLYMYPLLISQDSAKQLFIQLAESTITLEQTPRFYNTLSSNCTNELAKNANAVKPGTIPSTNRALYLPGYAEEELYKLGFIPTNKPLDQIRQTYDIREFTAKNYQDQDYSKKLRQFLLEKEASIGNSN